MALVGAGPGDPELITVKGWRLLTEADVVVADRLVPGLLLDELRPDVELVDASKIPYGPSRAQEEINRILVDRALAGQFVVRLKGGDPYVFGRGGEELLACAAAGVPVTVVPGVTSSIAVPGRGRHPGHPPGGGARVHRGLRARGARLAGLAGALGGPRRAARHPGDPDGAEEPGRRSAATLIAHGRPPDTPAAVIQEGTTAPSGCCGHARRGRRRRGRRAGLRPPAVVVVGDVVDALT